MRPHFSNLSILLALKKQNNFEYYENNKIFHAYNEKIKQNKK